MYTAQSPGAVEYTPTVSMQRGKTPNPMSVLIYDIKPCDYSQLQ